MSHEFSTVCDGKSFQENFFFSCKRQTDNRFLSDDRLHSGENNNKKKDSINQIGHNYFFFFFSINDYSAVICF